ncbi:hypothetical protein [Glutamicibacter ardleyensis]|uniref:hypothetical protein n=1 Tax=Glutamicibacter ardleyensis TaxID=225894 RepID=UPI003FD12800
MGTMYRAVEQGKTQKATAKTIYNFVAGNLERWLERNGGTDIDVTFRLDNSQVAVRFQQSNKIATVWPVSAPENPLSKAQPTLAGSLHEVTGARFKAVDGTVASQNEAIRALKVVVGRSRRWHTS